MREILFRGKPQPWEYEINREDKPPAWVYGSLLVEPTGDAVITDHDIGETYNVIAATVGQYTGMLDKNGKKIFEGDIINTNFYGRKTGTVIYDASGGLFCIQESSLAVPHFLVNIVEGKDLKIIGNIHDGEGLEE